MKTLRRLANLLVGNADRALKGAQVAALLWIGFELHDISNTMYTGPGPYDSDVSALMGVSERLAEIRSAITLK